MDPMMGFAQSAGAAINTAPQFDPMQFVMGRLNEVATMLADVAQVLVVEKPALLPILQKVAQGGSLLMNAIGTSMPQGMAGSDPNMQPTQAQMAEPEGAASGVAMS